MDMLGENKVEFHYSVDHACTTRVRRGFGHSPDCHSGWNWARIRSLALQLLLYSAPSRKPWPHGCAGARNWLFSISQNCQARACLCSPSREAGSLHWRSPVSSEWSKRRGQQQVSAPTTGTPLSRSWKTASSTDQSTRWLSCQSLPREAGAVRLMWQEATHLQAGAAWCIVRCLHAEQTVSHPLHQLVAAWNSGIGDKGEGGG